MKLLFFVTLLIIIFESIHAQGDKDKISGGLPGTTFKVHFDQYSGYLNAGNSGKWKFFYWLVESQTGNSANDPLIVWFTGGPGCSSVGSLYQEMGPFYVNSDGKTLFENIYAWNKYANVLAIESPIGVGFSYNTDELQNFTIGDDLTAQQNHDSLIDFFNNIQPRYKDRQWFLASESYGGIYVPTLTKLVFDSILANKFPNSNFAGIAIGNGYMNVRMNTNSQILWVNYHGLIGLSQWRDLINACCPRNSNLENCDFSAAAANSSCALKVEAALDLDGSYIDSMNVYQDCYAKSQPQQTKTILQKKRRAMMRQNFQSETKDNPNPYLAHSKSDQTADKINYDNSDNQLGYPCYNSDRTGRYLQQLEAQQAYHVNADWIKANITWQGCNGELGDQYPVTYSDTTDLFKYIIGTVMNSTEYFKNFKILIYNGDADTVCNFLGDSWFIDGIANDMKFKALDRIPWIFRHQYAGYHQPYYASYNNGANNVTIDVLTVKGAGHLVAGDKQGPSLQMIVNFIRGTNNYSSTDNFDVLPSPQPGINDGISSSPLPDTTVTTTTFTTTTTVAKNNSTTSATTQSQTTTTSNAVAFTYSIFTFIVAIACFVYINNM